MGCSYMWPANTELVGVSHSVTISVQFLGKFSIAIQDIWVLGPVIYYVYLDTTGHKP